MRDTYSPFDLFFGAIVVLSFGIIFYPALVNMAVVGDDAMLHLKWLAEFNTLKDSGIFYPRFCGDFQNHLGSPIFYFYPPLAFFAAWCIHDVCSSITPNGLFNIVQLFITIGSAASFYRYSGSFSTRRSDRLLCAMLYASLPYRFLDAFIRSAFSEHVAFIFFPLVLLGIERIRERSLRDERRISSAALILIAFSWAGLVLSSIPMTAIVGITVIPYALLRLPMRRRSWLEYILSSLHGVLIVAIYLVPLIAFLPQIDHGNVFQYPNEFRYAIYFLAQSRVDNLMLPVVMLIASVLLLLLLRKNSNRVVLALLALGTIVQIPHLADPLWNAHLFDTIMYPVRFCALLCVAMALGFLVSKPSERRPVMAVLSLLLLFSGYREIKWIINHSQTPPLVIASITFDTPMEYRLVLPKNATANIADTSLSIGESITETRREINHSHYHVALMKPRSATFERTFWPTWSAKSSHGTQLSLFCATDGRLSILLPAGNYDVELCIVKSAEETAGKIISLTSLLLLFIFGAGRAVRNYIQRP